MKKAIQQMQAMQNRLAQLKVSTSINTTFGDFGQAVTMYVHDDEHIVATVNWQSYDPERWGADWEEFELKIKERFLGWWE